MPRPFFILTVARSGSTSLARILDTAANGSCAVEPMPNLNVETRLAMDGKPVDRAAIVRDVLKPRVKAGMAANAVYGEKNLTYGPFVAEMYEQLRCRFVWIVRDGRDVVRSMLDWHDRMFGDIYRECRDPGQLSPRAISAAANLPVHHDTSDFSRPRPRPGDPLYDEWESLSRLEMCAYGWAHVNELYADAVAALPADAWTRIDYTRPSADDILRVADFLELRGFDAATVQEQLDGRINSLRDRTEEANHTPVPADWPSEWHERFDRIAGPTMERLGLQPAEVAR